MPRYRVVLLAEARDELRQIALIHKVKVGSKSAKRITDRILEALRKLEDFPTMGTLRPCWISDVDYRRLSLLLCDSRCGSTCRTHRSRKCGLYQTVKACITEYFCSKIENTSYPPHCDITVRGIFCEKKGGETAYQLKKKHVISLSGGKDSTALALRMREEGWPMDILRCYIIESQRKM